MCQPRRQRLLAGACARDRQQLEERAAAEEVEVVGVEVPVVAKAVAGFAGSGPPVLDTREAALVKLNGALRRPIARANDVSWRWIKHGEGRRRKSQPRRRDPAAPPGQRERQADPRTVISRAVLNRASRRDRSAKTVRRAARRGAVLVTGGTGISAL